MKTAKIFQNGQSQAVRLPLEFRFEGKEVFIKMMGHSVVLIPKENIWEDWVENLNEFSSDFMTERDQMTFEERDDL